jgi:hypothetical protein
MLHTAMAVQGRTRLHASYKLARQGCAAVHSRYAATFLK